jgi:putative membrane protein
MINIRGLSYLAFLGVLSVSLAGACSSDDDDDDDNAGGRAGTSQGGHSNNAGSTHGGQAGSTHGGQAGSTHGGQAGSTFAGEASDGGFPSENAGTGQGGANGGDASIGGAGAGGAGGAAAVAALSDAQILLVLDTLNQGEVEEAYAALPRLSAAEVKAFAQLMVTHHSAARQSIADTATALNEAPTPSDTQAELKDEAEAQVSRLRTTPTASLDATYVDLQVRAHAEALTLLDALATAADAAELATLLATLKTTVQQHYERAQQLQAAL